MSPPVKVDYLTCTSLFLECGFGESRLGIATGFIWEHENSSFLVTNWHVVTGLHPETRQPLSDGGATPDFLRVSFHRAEKLGSWEGYDIQLHDNQGRPRWKEHKEHGSGVDVAVLPLALPDKFKLFPVNKFEFTEFVEEVSQDVFIIGFPGGITGAGRFPIWKRGSIASEPKINLDRLPKFLIDSTTREGMSGSPVIGQYVGFHKDPTTPDPSGADWFGSGRKFLGVYSGRLPSQDIFEAQLGIVWKASVIEEIINSGVRPD